MAAIKTGCIRCSTRGDKPCVHFSGPHWFCHSCGFTRMLHKKPVTLTVVDGGESDDDKWSAWIDGEVKS